MIVDISMYLPGRVQTRVANRVPTTGRESTAKGVCLRPSLSSACATPGASRCSRGRIASGVRSRRPKPVPPEVSTKSTDCALPGSHHCVTTLWIASVQQITIITLVFLQEAQDFIGITVPMSSGTTAVVRMIMLREKSGAALISFSKRAISGPLPSSYTP